MFARSVWYVARKTISRLALYVAQCSVHISYRLSHLHCTALATLYIPLRSGLINVDMHNPVDTLLAQLDLNTPDARTLALIFWVLLGVSVVFAFPWHRRNPRSKETPPLDLVVLHTPATLEQKSGSFASGVFSDYTGFE